jgi:chromosome segregation ATPase
VVDEEMKTATENRDKAQREIETLTALKMEKSALSDSLAEDITTLSQEVADLTKGLAEETTLREEEQATNNQTLADAEAGLEAVKGAIEVLKGFYGEFIQIKSKENPAPTAEGYERYKAEGAGSDGKTVDDMAPEGSGAMPDSDYGGKADASKSIIGLLEVIESDFENTISSTTADEEAAETSYQDFKTESETSIDDKNTLKDTKDGEKTDAGLAITQAEADLKTENENLQNALDELEKLKPVCVDSGMSWEERTARREQEIESLKEALKILQETDFGFLQSKRH